MEKRKKDALAFVIIGVGTMTILHGWIWKMSWDIFHAPRPQEVDAYVTPLLLLGAFGIYLGSLRVIMRIYRNETSQMQL